MKPTKGHFNFADLESREVTDMLMAHIQDMKTQLLAFSEKFPKTEFINEIVEEFSKQTTIDLLDEYLVLTKAFMKHYDVFVLYDRYPDQYIKFYETVQNTNKLMEYASIICISQVTIKNLNSIPIQYN